jgi:hypothetical protein
MSKISTQYIEKWKFLLATYVLGYLITIYGSGIHNKYYLQPFKIIPLLISLTLGNLLYRTNTEKPNQIRIFYLSFIYMMPFIILVLASLSLQQWLSYHFQIDFGPIFGFPPGPIDPVKAWSMNEWIVILKAQC